MNDDIPEQMAGAGGGESMKRGYKWKLSLSANWENRIHPLPW